MTLSPRWVAVILALIIASITTSFLAFVEGSSKAMLFVTFISAATVSFFLVLYTIEIIVLREVNKMAKTIRKLKLRDFNISRKTLIKDNNPIKRINDEIFVYVAKKQKEIEELRKTEQFRREFLADVSHELKTPIFAAQGFIHTLLDGAIDDENVRVKFLKKAAKSLDGLDILVRDLVSLSQMESGEIRMNPQPVDIRELTYDIFDRLDKIARDRKIQLKVKQDFGEEIWVTADKQRIDQVMVNLIENAIKYGYEGGRVVVHFNDDRKKVKVSVRDDGPGIPAEHIGRIFERFYRVDKSRSKEKGGSGLGLAIVKHILGGHKTTITVMSEIEKGTAFTFKLEKGVPLDEIPGSDSPDLMN